MSCKKKKKKKEIENQKKETEVAHNTGELEIEEA